PRELRSELASAGQARDATRLQRLLDPRALLVVHVNPESRVKVNRGPASARIQQAGFTPVLIKVLNESTVTKRLRMTSPQGGAVYGGAAKFSLQRQGQPALNDDENAKNEPGRFLSVAMFEDPPMRNRLSGLTVEYVIGLIYSHEAGRREATIGFDLGQGTQDLGFRAETPVLFDVAPAVAVRLAVRDHDGQPTMGRFEFRDPTGRVHPPQAKRLAPDLFFQPHIYRGDGETVLLPPGKFRVTYGRGPEYRVQTTELTVETDKPASLAVKLQRWIDPPSFSYYGGDHHIHGAGCAHYTIPTEGVTPVDMFRQVKGEGLNVGCVLTWGPCFRFQRQYFSPRPNDLSEHDTLLKYDLEISGFGSQALGHVCLLNLRNQEYPGSDGLETKGWPTWTLPVLKWTKEQGGYTGYAHSASGLHIDPAAATKRLLANLDADRNGRLDANEAARGLLPEEFRAIDSDADGSLTAAELTASHERASDRLPNYAIPEMNGVGAMEIFVTVPLGVCDFISAMDTRRIQEWNTWYHLLNCGFPLKVSGETDFPCMSSRQVGQGRVYVQLDKPRDRPLDYAQWCAGLASGRSYVSDGYAHAIDFAVNDHRAGPTPVKLSGSSGESHELRVKARVAFAPEMPRSIALGLIAPPGGRRFVGDTVELHGERDDAMTKVGPRTVELIVNGEVAGKIDVPADGAMHDVEFNLKVDKSSWVALRQFPQLHTNPVTVLVDDKPIRADERSRRWCQTTLDLLWQNRRNTIAANERPAAEAAYQAARAKFD
ncbi:MAG TPA: CehA/McbA family metallohydrolase, partial [Pirellulaceae bacterium]|nr:CehA/McbA family metallohydrolase [Pirellulaceae bacterium]